jgi:hypothetical protein
VILAFGRWLSLLGILFGFFPRSLYYFPHLIDVSALLIFLEFLWRNLSLYGFCNFYGEFLSTYEDISEQHWALHVIINDSGCMCLANAIQAPSGDLFGASAFQAAPSSAPDMFGAPALQAPPPPSIPGLFPAPPAYQPPILPANSATGESFEAFGSGGSNGNAVPSSASGSIFPPPQSAPTFDFAPSNGGGFSQGSTVLQGESYSNQSVGSTQPSSNVQSYNNNQPFGHSQSLSSQQSQLGSTQAQPSTNGSTLQPQQQPKKTFAPPKSTLWADTLSTGLVDLNIAGRMCLFCCHALFYSCHLQVFLLVWNGYQKDKQQGSLCRLFGPVTP